MLLGTAPVLLLLLSLAFFGGIVHAERLVITTWAFPGFQHATSTGT
uniref:ABC transporter permease n=1 Tax=Steinernema glaseri TaxID=37863 RepID=A0A1I7YAY6_9BILA